jgi:hypothetical protein
VTDHPLLFRGEMVRALLDGRKSQTRRPAWRVGRLDAEKASPTWFPTAARRIKVGDVVWVRETFDHRPGVVVYRADGFSWHLMPGAPVWPIGKTPNFTPVWQSSTRMPRRYSRLTLAVTGTRVERLQDISEGDALAEGIISHPALTGPIRDQYGLPQHSTVWALPTAKLAYVALYESIHGHDAWDANPEVVVLTFTAHDLNIDAFKKQAAA